MNGALLRLSRITVSVKGNREIYMQHRLCLLWIRVGDMCMACADRGGRREVQNESYSWAMAHSHLQTKKKRKI